MAARRTPEAPHDKKEAEVGRAPRRRTRRTAARDRASRAGRRARRLHVVAVPGSARATARYSHPPVMCACGRLILLFTNTEATHMGHLRRQPLGYGPLHFAGKKWNGWSSHYTTLPPPPFRFLVQGTGLSLGARTCVAFRS